MSQGKCGETAMAKPIRFRCAEDALAAGMEQAYRQLEAAAEHLRDMLRGPCPLCDYSDQRCQCYEVDA